MKMRQKITLLKSSNNLFFKIIILNYLTHPRTKTLIRQEAKFFRTEHF